MKKFYMSLTIFLLTASHVILSADQSTPKCHVYLDSAGYTLANVRKQVKVAYSSTNLCQKSPLKNFLCYSYFEEKSKCTSSDKTLIDLFIKDAKNDNKLI